MPKRPWKNEGTRLWETQRKDVVIDALAADFDPTDDNSYQSALERVERGQSALDAMGKLGWEKDAKVKYGRELSDLRNKLHNKNIDYKTTKTIGEVRGIRAEGKLNLESQLRGMATDQFTNIFRPQMRQALNARGLLFSGAVQGTEQSQLASQESQIQSRVGQYGMETVGQELNIGLEGAKAKLGAERENAINGFNTQLAQISSDLTSE